MVNLYKLLGLPAMANTQQITAAIQAARQQGQLNQEVLDKAQAWLLNAEVKTRYDAQLRQAEPAFFVADGIDFAAELDAIPVVLPPPMAPTPTAAPHTQPRVATNQHNRQRDPIKRSGKANKKQGRGCLVAFLVVAGLSVVLLVVIGLWAYSIYKDTKTSLNNFSIPNMQTTPGWHQGLIEGDQVTYAVSQNHPNVVFVLFEKQGTPALFDRNDDQALSCHQNGHFMCKVQVQFDQDLVKNYQGGQLDRQIVFSGEAEKVEMILRAQDAQTMHVGFPDNSQAPPLEFVLGDFPQGSLTRNAAASTADAAANSNQKIDALLKKVETLEQEAAEKQAQ